MNDFLRSNDGSHTKQHENSAMAKINAKRLFLPFCFYARFRGGLKNRSGTPSKRWPEKLLMLAGVSVGFSNFRRNWKTHVFTIA